ncbi:50S ribosomal protein L29 [Candidatus Kuenenbacteria bacterium]|nr:50S ribosomal protein L29 [Candidatus Kuenenbacteria bacterium]
MTIQELKTKSDAELKKLLGEKKESLRVMRFKVAQRQLKKVHEVKTAKQEIARIMTFINKQKEQK